MRLCTPFLLSHLSFPFQVGWLAFLHAIAFFSGPHMLFAVVLAFVALGQQVVLSASFRFNFSTSIEQCAPVQISFTGNDDADPIPTSLLLLPLNSTPFSIPIANAAANSTGVTVSFLPLAAGTQFLASLDDSFGDNAAKVSDVFRVQPSPTNDNSCLPPDPPPPLFTLPTSVSQCEAFSIGYQDAAPSVRVFFPTGGSFPLAITHDLTKDKTAQYTLNVTHGFPVLVMAFPAGNPDAGLTTPLLTVGGDASSNTSCIVSHNNTSSSSSSSSSSSPPISKGLVIGLAVGGAVIMLVALMMIIYVVHERRRRRRGAANIAFNPDMLEKRSSYSKNDMAQSPGFILSREYKQSMAFSQTSKTNFPSPGYSLRYEEGFVKDPPYTTENYSPSNSEFDRTPVSWVSGPASLKYTISRVISQKATIRSAKTASSINPYDIEEMLDVAAQESPEPVPVPEIREPTSPKKPVATEKSPRSPTTLAIPRNMPARGHLRSPDDVPAGPTSMAMSSYSNMLGENSVMYDSPESLSSPSSRFSYASSSNFEILTRPSNAIITSPLTRQPASSRFSDASAFQGEGLGTSPAK